MTGECMFDGVEPATMGMFCMSCYITMNGGQGNGFNDVGFGEEITLDAGMVGWQIDSDGHSGLDDGDVDESPEPDETGAGSTDASGYYGDGAGGTADAAEQAFEAALEEISGTLDAFPMISRHSNGAENPLFMAAALAEIVRGGKSHPLSKLLDSGGTKWLGRVVNDRDIPTVQAGHTVGRRTLRREVFALEDADFNVTYSSASERQGVVFVRRVLDIAGVPVESRTARMWANCGVLDQAVFLAAKPHPGWSAGHGYQKPTRRQRGHARP